jgi:hypothetical protein
MQEQWIKWEPIQGLLAKYYIDSVSDSVKGFEVMLSDDNYQNKVRIFFKNSVDSYGRTDETYRQQLISVLRKQYDTKVWAEWTFFKVMNSAKVQRLSEESLGSGDRELIHFSWLAADSVLDVIATYQPVVELITISN